MSIAFFLIGKCNLFYQPTILNLIFFAIFVIKLLHIYPLMEIWETILIYIVRIIIRVIYKFSSIMEIWGIFLSAFLGFLSAIFVQYLFQRIGDYRNKKIIIQGIKKELKAALLDIDRLQDDYYIHPIERSFWDGIVHSGGIYLINKDQSYQQILNIYSMIDTTNRWEDLNSKMYFLNVEKKNKSDIIKRAIKDQRKILQTEIQKFFELTS